MLGESLPSAIVKCRIVDRYMSSQSNLFDQIALQRCVIVEVLLRVQNAQQSAHTHCCTWVWNCLGCCALIPTHEYPVLVK